MALTRAALEQGLMRQILHDSGDAGGALSDDELDRNVDAMLAEYGDGDPWVFAYGSLIWNPLLEHVERRCAKLRGYHRRFCLWSTTTRGSSENPGLVLGLENGGCCRGVVLRIERDRAREEFRLLWRREMLAGTYQARWIPVQTDLGDVKALAFVVDRRNSKYAGRLTVDEIAAVMRSAVGKLGTSRDYMRQTVEGLRSHGIADPLLAAIEARVCALELSASPAGLAAADAADAPVTDISVLDSIL